MTTENNGPAQALSVLYEANDLLNVVRERGENDMSAPDWTLTGEVSRRLDMAIAHLDGAVPAPGDEPEAKRQNWPTGAMDALNEARLAADSIQGICSVSLADQDNLPDTYRGVMRAIQAQGDLIEKHLDDCESEVRGLPKGGAA